MFCKKCGTQLSDNSKFCSNCGYKIEETTSTENAENIEIYNSQIESESKHANPSSTNHLNKTSDILFLGGFVSATFGTILFIGIILVSLIGWGKVYLYGGYDFTATLTTISLILMLLGFVLLTFTLALNLKLKSIKLLTRKTFMVFSIVLITLCIGLSAWGFVDYANKQNFEDYNDYYSSATDKIIGLSLKVDNIKISGSYTYVYCTVTNVSSKYVATKYRYVKVKAQFKDYYGSIVDTDWTYAVDSTWLEPGESKTFYYMVKNTNIKSATLSFVD